MTSQEPYSTEIFIRSTQVSPLGKVFQLGKRCAQKDNSIMLRISLIFLLIPAICRAETGFKWLNPQGKLFSGKCYEYDLATNGESYLNKVDNKKCKTNDTSIIFHNESGECIEIDNPSSGKNYLIKLAKKKCRPKETVFKLTIINGRHGCYEVDKKTMGDEFFYKTRNELCDKDNKTYFWKSLSELKGTCHTKDEYGQYIQVNIDLCRPTEPRYEFIKKDFYNGNCYEIHPDGSQFFVKKVLVKKCKPILTDFVFVKDEKKIVGKCYEIDKKTNGKKYIKKVSNKLCK